MDLADGKSLAKLAGVLAASLLTGAVCYDKFYKKKTKWVKVGIIDKLYMHALKGGRAREIYSADFGWLGLKAGYFVDRSYMLINMSHQAVYSMDVPRTVLVDLVHEDGKFIFRADSMPDLEVHPDDLVMKDDNQITCRLLDTDIKCVAVGKRYDEWFSKFLCDAPTGLKLAYFGERAERPARPGFVAMWPETFKPTDLTTFNNTTAYNLLTWGSVKAINKLLDVETTPVWYRPSIVISSINGEPYEEENWRKRLRIGKDVVLHFIKECQRCNVITVDPDTGVRDMSNIEKLREFRLMKHGIAGTDNPVLQKRRVAAMGQSPFFSVNYGIDSIGHVNVGDEVWAEFDE